jgi:putative flippase GtrA
MNRRQSAKSSPWVSGSRHSSASKPGEVFLKFVLVGGVGFGIDYGVLRLLVTEWGWHWALARIPSFRLAVCVTWTLNRTLTFGSSNRWAGKSIRYLVTQSIGSAINLVVFSGIVVVFGGGTLLVPLAVGAAAGLVSNFLMSKYVVFSERPKR